MRIRNADRLDVEVAVEFMLAMLDEMASVEGHPLAERGQVSAWLRERITSAIHAPDHLLLVAETSSSEPQTIGVVEASITELHAVFAPKRVLHIHAIYVQPSHRRQGIARSLMVEAMQRGKLMDCEEVALNTLVGNPARRLYESMGFQVFELDMRKSL
jgi:ribosomal protein S18 acetylase RimI-like enzyme